ncbi:MAG: putative zinc ribbon domain protein [Syntrophorhabdus sp. PtaU1.Bin058]|nr:MAG: putative zinc ribbon domain protein [Syntrophorhabdus sp. PtaU1.Bin058]
MEHELGTLYEAQKIELQIIEKETKRQTAPKKLQEMDEELKQLKERLEKEKTIFEELEKERKKKEKELDVDKDKIKKIESKLYEVKTNKEYQALLKEIEAAKATNDKTEEDILTLMEKIEELKKDYESSQVKLQKRGKDIEVEKARLDTEVQSMDKIIGELKVQRDNLLSVVSNELRSKYDMLKVRRGGIAVTNVKNGVCLGCFMNIPPQLFIEVTKNKRLIQCPSCNRILYFTDSE